MEKSRLAATVGIVVATTSAQGYACMTRLLKAFIIASGRKPYVMMVGKINEAKMANFAEIDVFVIVSCPENAVIDAEDYYHPVITPYEAVIAFHRDNLGWQGRVLPDYSHLKEVLEDDRDAEGDDGMRRVESEDADVPQFSVATGGLIPSGQQLAAGVTAGFSNNRSGDQLVVREGMEMVRHTDGASFLASRSWKGLDARLGQDKPAEIEEGRTGIAASYTHEADDKHQG